MIQSNELRIGNWINLYDNFNSQVTGLTNTKKVWCVKNPIDEKCAWFTNNLNAIPLTEEWLIDFGFKRGEDKNRFNLDGKEIYIFTDVNDKPTKVVFNPSSSTLYVNLKYVHKLQNLFFELNGIELTL
tara:strand:+ start:27 stop:410 length:384 start_codon:yes stop_codon:yes gene_type:complete